ncbi:MAG: glycosyltransferase [Acidobacteria bacterium]|nr:glycosyltransferase [Acidobacteriota bacterium]
MKTLIVIPSYNEGENIRAMVEAILALDPQYSVCVVDDSSPDHTSDIVRAEIRSQTEWERRVHLIQREKKDGRGSAVRDGFLWGLNSEADFKAFVEMDCDFSHDPKAIAQGLQLLEEGWDVGIGARYPNGLIVGWPASRRIFSFCANTLARVLIQWSVPDYTNGFRFYTPKAVGLLAASRQQYKGYIYLSESLSQLLRAGLRVRHFPIHFVNRQRGVSNTNLQEISASLKAIFVIAWQHHFAE